jgi:hypothetical protein
MSPFIVKGTLNRFDSHPEQHIREDEYAPRQPRRHGELQQVLFPYTEAI